MHQHGIDDEDALVELMKTLKIPVTKENYMDIAYMGDDHVLSAEEEADLPEEVRGAGRVAGSVKT